MKMKKKIEIEVDSEEDDKRIAAYLREFLSEHYWKETSFKINGEDY